MPSQEEMQAFAAGRIVGALITIKRDGRPHAATINYTFDPATGDARLSTTDDRVKTRNLRRDPRASLFVPSADAWSYVVLEGEAELSPVAQEWDDATVEHLIDVYRTIRNEEHPDWDDYRRAMVDDRRLVVTLHVHRLYGDPPDS